MQLYAENKAPFDLGFNDPWRGECGRKDTQEREAVVAKPRKTLIGGRWRVFVTVDGSKRGPEGQDATYRQRRLRCGSRAVWGGIGAGRGRGRREGWVGSETFERMQVHTLAHASSPRLTPRTLYVSQQCPRHFQRHHVL